MHQGDMAPTSTLKMVLAMDTSRQALSPLCQSKSDSSIFSRSRRERGGLVCSAKSAVQKPADASEQACHEGNLSRRDFLASAGIALSGFGPANAQPLSPAHLRNPGPASAVPLEVAGSTGGDGQGVPQRACKRPALVVGNYCHDLILLPGGQQATVLGGAVSYIANVYDALGLDAQVVSKVGADFAYTKDVVAHPPKVVPGQFTTQFLADLSGNERVLTASHVCDPVYARDLPGDCTFEIGLAAGIAGEILPETIVQIAKASRLVIVDLQSLIRVVDPWTGAVGLCRLEDTPYHDLIPSVSFLKVARNEALFLDVEAVRKTTSVIVTEGAKGSRVFSANSEYRVPAFPAQLVDRTGAGDSFLAGFSAGIYQGLAVDKAVLLGNYFGALAVSQVGVPHFSPSQLRVASLQLQYRSRLQEVLKTVNLSKPQSETLRCSV